MTQPDITDDSPGAVLFPQFQTEIYEMFRREVEGLTDEQLDFESDQWGWSQWSIRRNLSHVASGDFRWLLQRWGAPLFPEGFPDIGDWAGIIESSYDRRLDEEKYWQVADILPVLRRGLDLSLSVMERETVASMRSREVQANIGGQLNWLQVHPNGVRPDPEQPGQGYITLEATFRHRYYEYITHLYNIQRMKRAQGLATVIEIPFEGYWAMSDWDRSEA